MPGEVMFSPEPILAAADRYRGTIVDLDSGMTVDAAQFNRGWHRLAKEMADAGLSPGDRLVLAVGNGPLFPAALAAILSQGGVPLLVHAETPYPELERLAAQIDARFLVADGCAQFSPGASRDQFLGGDSWTRTRWVESDPGTRAVAPVLPRASAISGTSLRGTPLHPTSGSTGQPKIAVRPGFCALEEARHYAETLGIDHRDVLLVAAPMSHAYAYGMGVMVPLLTSASLVTMRKFNARQAYRALAEQRISIFPAVPAMFQLLLLGGSDQLRAPPRCILSAGAPLSEDVALAFQSRMGVGIRALYGSTETGGISIAESRAESAEGAVGRPMNGVEVEMRLPPEGTTWGESVGRVHVRSSSMMAGYLCGSGDNQSVEDSALDDGWFATGDLGRTDPSGVIHLVGRDSDVINVYGMKVVPHEVEQIIAAVPGVTEVVVYAGRHGDGSQYIKAAVVGAGVDPARMDDHCRQHLVNYKRPESIIVVPQLPRSPSGKVCRKDLP